ncbi:MAG: hypothetical protein AB1648_07805 [Pseudomonadota bacterium]
MPATICGERQARSCRCYSIQDADAKQLCLARLTGDKSRCYNVRDKDRRAACLAGMWR